MKLPGMYQLKVGVAEGGVVLEIEQNLKLPPPLDPHVASVSIRTGSNNPSDFFDLRLSASFGREVVTLDSGGELIEVMLSIKKAEIKFNSVNSSLHLIEVQSRESEAWTGRSAHIETRDSSKASSADVTLDISKGSINAKLGGGTEGKLAMQATDLENIERAVLPWRILSDDTLQLGYLDKFDKDLMGKVVDESVSIRVRPNDTAQKVGVLARVRIRENWIELSDASIRKDSSKLKKYWAGLVTKDKAGEERRRLFSRLLAHLIAVELQDPNDLKHATIAAAAIVMVPTQDKFSGIASPRQRQVIAIDPKAVENFLKSDVGDELRILRELGVEIEQNDDEELADSLMDFWQQHSDNVLRRYLIGGFEVTRLADLFSDAFGLDLEITTKSHRFSMSENFGGVDSIQRRLTARFGNRRRPLRSTLDLLQRPGREQFSISLLDSGLVIKGEQAYRFSQLLGFSLSYQSFQKRIAPYAFKSGYGNLVTYQDIAIAVGRPDALNCLVGREFVLPVGGRLEIL